MTGPGPRLAGRRVLLTRPAGRGNSLAGTLRGLGAVVEMRPTIAFESTTELQAARQAVRTLAQYDWLVFTSRTGVGFFLELFRKLCGDGAGIARSIASIGPATARALERAGYPSAVVAEDSRSEGLARTLGGQVTAGQRVLVVQPEVARPVLVRELRALGARVDPVSFYRTVPAADLDVLVRELCADRFDVVLFSSPSTLERLLEAGATRGAEVLAALQRSRPVAIGPVTAGAIESAGLKPAGVAAEPSDESVVRCIESLFP